MSREQSAIIKGIAILLMFVCHISNIAGVGGLDNAFWNGFGEAAHCVNYFLLVSGYGLYLVYHKNRLSCQYLFKRTLRLYVSYWIVLLIFPVCLGALLYPGRFSYQVPDIISGFTSWRWHYSSFTWFLLPYVLMTTLAKPVFLMIDRLGSILSLVLGTVVYIVTTFIISRYYLSWLRDHYLAYHVILMLQMLLGVIIGAVMARLTLKGVSFLVPWLKGRNLLIFALIVAAFVLRGSIHFAALNPFFATLVVWLVLHVEFHEVPRRFLIEMGDKSMLMWLAQGFLGYRMFSEYIVLLPNPVMVLVVWVLVTYAVSLLLTPVANRVASVLRLTR